MNQNDLLLERNIIPHFTHVVKRICTKNWKIPKSIFTEYNIIFLFKGSSYIECNDKKYTLKKGDIFCFKPGDLRYGHTFEDDLMECFAISFVYTCPEYIDSKWVLKNVPFNIKALNHVDNPYVFKKLYSHFESLIGSYISDRDDKLIVCRREFLEILSLLLFWQKNSTIDYSKLKKVDHAISFMTNDFEEKFTLDQIADKLSISKSYLCKIFKEITGKSPVKYYNTVRINKAKSYLKDNFSVSETAKLTGFNDVYYFSKCFKQITGISPSKYFS